MTTYSQEYAKQQRWKLRPQYAGFLGFHELVNNEFCSEQEHLEWQGTALRNVLDLAARHTPYYAGLLARLGLRPEEIGGPADLPRLPILRKQDVIQHQDELRSRWLPPGERIKGWTRSSGTTGRPVTVVHTEASFTMFTVLGQRLCRWFDLDPAGTRLDVRITAELPQEPGSDGPVRQLTAWRYLGQVFETGPEYAFSVAQPMEQQVAWVAQLRPDYVLSYPGTFEEWLLATEGRMPSDSLKALIGVGTQLTPSLRQRLEKGYGLPILQGYGLNEIGKVGVRCEAGRYHIHTEHCLAEVVTADGQPCPPGQTGHVLVTGLRNLAMPLIRYDTGDLAVAVAGPCPCGRSLPAIGELAGRFVRYAGLPAGTRERVRALLRAVEGTPAEQLAFLRGYQIHQDRENRFELRLRTVGPIPEAFRQALQRAWEPVAGSPPVPLALVAVAAIAASPSGKLLEFTSDLYTDAYAVPRAEG